MAENHLCEVYVFRSDAWEVTEQPTKYTGTPTGHQIRGATGVQWSPFGGCIAVVGSTNGATRLMETKQDQWNLLEEPAMDREVSPIGPTVATADGSTTSDPLPLKPE
jgi:hypothetical protein